jgi:lipoyl-dependent peroxiredoxin
MAEIDRSAEATWRGDLASGSGELGSNSGTLKQIPYNRKARFEEPVTGTNPEEILAAAHAACYSMAFAGQLSKRGHKVDSVDTRAIVHISNASGGWKVTKITLETRGKVEGIDQAAFAALAKEVDEQHCPISAALRAVEHEVKATLS